MRGRLIDLSMGMNRRQRVTIELDRDFREDFDRLKNADLDEEARALGIETDTPTGEISGKVACPRATSPGFSPKVEAETPESTEYRRWEDRRWMN